MEVNLQTGSLLECSWLSLPLGLRCFFSEIDISGCFGHAHFWKKCVFTGIWSEYPPRYSKILSGGSPEAFRSLSETICVSKALGQSWKAFCVETIMFFCKGGATDLFRRRTAKVTCTKYRACAQKLCAVFELAPTTGPRPVLPTPQEPLQINLFGESVRYREVST